MKKTLKNIKLSITNSYIAKKTLKYGVYNFNNNIVYIHCNSG